jgi:hypothetical protein
VQVQETRGKGDLLGEASFFFRLRHINTAVVAEGSTMLFVLSYDDYQQLSSAYVNDAAAVMDIIIDQVNDSGRAGKSQGSASSGGSGNTDPGMHPTSSLHAFHMPETSTSYTYRLAQSRSWTSSLRLVSLYVCLILKECLCYQAANVCPAILHAFEVIHLLLSYLCVAYREVRIEQGSFQDHGCSEAPE